MASRNFLVAGLDPTGLVCLSLADLLQMFQESKPSDDLGWVIQQEATPNTVTYPELATFLWLKPSTGELKYYDGSSWELCECQALIGPGTITKAMLSTTGASARQLIQVDAGGATYNFVNPANVFNANELPVAKLVNATDENYIMYSGVGGVWSSTHFPTLFTTTLAAANLAVANLRDLGSTGIANQVLSLVSVGGAFTFNYVESLLRDNQVPTSKLQFAAGSGGKYVKVNAARTDLEFADGLPTMSVATLVDSQVSGTAPQALVATTLTTVRLAVESAQSWLTLASNEFTLSAGTYLVQAVVPLYYAGGAVEAYIGLYNVTAASMLKRVNAPVTVDGDYTTATLLFSLTVTASTTYAIKAYASQAATIGKANSFASVNEVYAQVALTKLT